MDIYVQMYLIESDAGGEDDPVICFHLFSFLTVISFSSSSIFHSMWRAIVIHHQHRFKSFSLLINSYIPGHKLRFHSLYNYFFTEVEYYYKLNVAQIAKRMIYCYIFVLSRSSNHDRCETVGWQRKLWNRKVCLVALAYRWMAAVDARC